MNRRSFLVASAAALFAISACDSNAPRALVLVTPRGPHAHGLEEKIADFERKTGRGVRLLRVDSTADAVQLASRGEAEVMVVSEATDLDDFFSAQHGRVIGLLMLEGERFQVVQVSAQTHPKVDGEWAEKLAGYFLGAEIKPPRR